MATHLIFLPGKYNGQRSLIGYSPQGHKEWDRAQAYSSLTLLHRGTNTTLQSNHTPVLKDRKGKILQSIEPGVRRTELKVQRTETSTKEIKGYRNSSRKQRWALAKRGLVPPELGELATHAWLDFGVSLDQCVPLVPSPFLWEYLSTLTVLALPLHCILVYRVRSMWMEEITCLFNSQFS